MHTCIVRTRTVLSSFLLGGWLQRSNSCRRAGLACVLGVLATSCATGSSIDGDDVLLIPRTAGAEGSSEPAEAEATAEGLEPSTSGAEAAAEAELTPVSAETGEGGPAGELPRGDQRDNDEQSPSRSGDAEPAGAEPSGEDAAPDPEPNVDDPDVGLPPVTQPSPPADTPSSDPTDAPPATEPEPLPSVDPDPTPTPVPPVEGHCLEAWEGSSCDVCSGQTQSDRLACRVHIECYIANDCDPISCGSLEAACGANRLGNGLAPKEIADAVYDCMCGP